MKQMCSAAFARIPLVLFSAWALTAAAQPLKITTKSATIVWTATPSSRLLPYGPEFWYYYVQVPRLPG